MPKKKTPYAITTDHAKGKKGEQKVIDLFWQGFREHRLNHQNCLSRQWLNWATHQTP
ncbi:hypothetical protein [Cysteiniphilum marinum]|uniref:hypothetical protein n=1 Tax=Cysteiniphilum marinum TaxID=2774191 RepID=UPI00193C6006|nr:hypothetical protein [Cysteiniphilum marinum]